MDNPKPLWDLNTFYWCQVYALDSAVVKTRKPGYRMEYKCVSYNLKYNATDTYSDIFTWLDLIIHTHNRLVGQML